MYCCCKMQLWYQVLGYCRRHLVQYHLKAIKLHSTFPSFCLRAKSHPKWRSTFIFAWPQTFSSLSEIRQIIWEMSILKNHRFSKRLVVGVYHHQIQTSKTILLQFYVFSEVNWAVLWILAIGNRTQKNKWGTKKEGRWWRMIYGTTFLLLQPNMNIISGREPFGKTYCTIVHGYRYTKVRLLKESLDWHNYAFSCFLLLFHCVYLNTTF